MHSHTSEVKRRWQFGLAWLMWLTSMSALAAWLLTLPPVIMTRYHRVDPATGRLFERPTNWPAEVAIRIVFCVGLLLIPVIVSRGTLKILTRVCAAVALTLIWSFIAVCMIVITAIMP